MKGAGPTLAPVDVVVRIGGWSAMKPTNFHMHHVFVMRTLVIQRLFLK